MVEAQGNLFEPDFNRAIKVQATDQRLTSNAGIILVREAEHTLGFVDSIAQDILDPRDETSVRLLGRHIPSLTAGGGSRSTNIRLGRHIYLTTRGSFPRPILGNCVVVFVRAYRAAKDLSCDFYISRLVVI